MTNFRRRTVKDQIEFSGRGLHTGGAVRAAVHPGEKGIAFRQGTERLHAIPENVSDTTRCTRLGGIATVEHLMSALAGLGVTDAEVEVSGGELPALDGCALAFCRGLSIVGFEDLGEQAAKPPYSRVFHADEQVKISVSAGEGLWRYEFECGDRWPGSQHFEFSFADDFAQEVAPARTFAFAEELEAVRAAGLGRGLDETTAFVIGEGAYLNDVRFPDEPARHKMLDLIGDLYLSGLPPRMLNVVSSRSGHRHNVAMAAKLRACVG